MSELMSYDSKQLPSICYAQFFLFQPFLNFIAFLLLLSLLPSAWFSSFCPFFHHFLFFFIAFLFFLFPYTFPLSLYSSPSFNILLILFHSSFFFSFLSVNFLFFFTLVTFQNQFLSPCKLLCLYFLLPDTLVLIRSHSLKIKIKETSWTNCS